MKTATPSRLLIVVLSRSGNVGKSLVAKNLLAPNLPGALEIEIEDLNAGETSNRVRRIGAEGLNNLAAEMFVSDDDQSYVIDVGSSLFKRTVKTFTTLETTQESIDFWVILVEPIGKQVADAMGTIADLLDMGVPPTKIVVIINKVEDGDIHIIQQLIETTCAPILDMRKDGVHVAGEYIKLSDAYRHSASRPESIFELTSFRPDFDALLIAAKESGDKAARHEVGIAMVKYNHAVKCATNLRAVWASTPMALNHKGI